MKFKLKISKKRLLQFMLFTAITGVAFIFDEYFENHPGTLNELQTPNEESTGDHGTIYLFAQSVNLNAKPAVQKIPERKLYGQLHNKFLQKCHQSRNNEVLKTGPETIKPPLFLSCHHLIFTRCYFSRPDDEPLLS